MRGVAYFPSIEKVIGVYILSQCKFHVTQHAVTQSDCAVDERLNSEYSVCGGALPSLLFCLSKRDFFFESRQ